MTTDAKPQKSTIYLDAEDEITAIIDKVKSAHSNIVAVVPPKRAAALQSVVNLKLLQRAARSSKKNLVLVTTEPSLLPLAGTVGMMVAKSTSSKPEVPPAPDHVSAPADDEDEVVETGEEPEIDASKSVGELAAPAAAASDEVETVELPDAPKQPPADKAAKKKDKAQKPDKKLKVPNFNTFRKRMLLAGGVLILLIVLFVFANVVLPSAKIIVKTDTSSTDVSLNVTGSTSANGVDTDNLVVPITQQEYKQTDSEKTAATGQKNVGEKATGTVDFSNNTTSPVTVSAGAQLKADGGLAFTVDSSVTVPAGQVSCSDIFTCSGSPGTASGSVTAAEAGAKYNGASGTLSGAPSGVEAAFSGSASGGTDKTVKVVSQSDIDAAKKKILDRSKDTGESQLQSQFDQQGAIPLKDTLKTGDPVVTSSPNVNSEGDEVSVTVVVTYTESGVKRDDLNKIIEAQVNRQIDTSKQQVQSTGLDDAILKVTSNSGDTIKFQVQTVALAGPQLDIEGIKKEIAGKKRGETTSLIMARPGIKDVEISYSPFWVFSTPKRTNKISITFESANASQ
ncbi:hypothetical protein KC957_02875 [Candidatus Saccharibacteria bacterium]|nr:hypothetical protein [Candidatus Saccharibacteria bacterium]